VAISYTAALCLFHQLKKYYSEAVCDGRWRGELAVFAK